jgi:deaminated glutathione amidase
MEAGASLFLLFLVALLAGFVDSIAGGGGLLSIPALLWAGLGPIETLATNKAQAVFGSGTAAANFIHNGQIELWAAAFAVACTFVGAAAGARLVRYLDGALLGRLIPLLLIGFALYFLLSPRVSDLGSRERLGSAGFALSVGLGVGFYDGCFGPGAGTSFAMGYVALCGYNLRRATAHSKLLNFASNCWTSSPESHRGQSRRARPDGLPIVAAGFVPSPFTVLWFRPAAHGDYTKGEQMKQRYKVAAVQMASGADVEANLCAAERLIEAAAADGAGLVVLPENFAFMGERADDLLGLRETDGDGPLQSFLARVAKEQGVWLVGGTIPLVADDADRVRAACLVFDEQGRRVGRYDKVHLFDCSVPGVDERYQESAIIEPGTATLTIDSPFGRLGLAVCYDLRFPELFRRLLDDGMELVAIPAAFTAATGQAHWETLVRARAIENLAYVVAAAQGGLHPNGRETHGHSLVVDPWGRVLAQVPRGAGFVCCPVDPESQVSVRRNFPAIDHRRLKCGD